MKKILLIMVCCFAALSSFGQSQITDKGLIYSEGGFKIIKVRAPDKYNCSGLYSSDGKVLVSAFTSINADYSVAYGTEVIAKNAFRKHFNILYIPSTMGTSFKLCQGCDFF